MAEDVTNADELFVGGYLGKTGSAAQSEEEHVGLSTDDAGSSVKLDVEAPAEGIRQPREVPPEVVLATPLAVHHENVALDGTRKLTTVPGENGEVPLVRATFACSPSEQPFTKKKAWAKTETNPTDASGSSEAAEARARGPGPVLGRLGRLPQLHCCS